MQISNGIKNASSNANPKDKPYADHYSDVGLSICFSWSMSINKFVTVSFLVALAASFQ